MKLLGLTGGIGSGKSTVAHMLRELGATIVDADAISRATTAAGGSAMAAIRTVFGEDFVDSAGALNRTKMRDLVFVDATAKQKLENITHPLIKQAMQDQIATATTPWVVLDLPLLAERTSFDGWRPLLDAVWVVDCLESTQITRVMARNQMLESQVRAVIENQASRQARLAIADVVITNEGLALAALKLEVASAFAKLQ
jgi:dephospho-CoA kinase